MSTAEVSQMSLLAPAALCLLDFPGRSLTSEKDSSGT